MLRGRSSPGSGSGAAERHLAEVVPAPPGSEGTAGAGAPCGAEPQEVGTQGGWQGGWHGPARPDPSPPPPPTMSLPAGMEGSRGAPHSLAPPPQPAQGSLSAPAAPALPPAPPPSPLRLDEPQRGRPCPCPFPCPPGVLPALPLLLALLQVGLGSALLALSFATVWLGSAPQVKGTSSAWAGFSAMLCGIFALTTWKRSVILIRLLVLLSLICVPLSLTGFMLGCQGIEFLSRVPRCNLMDKENKICFCCEEPNLVKCTEVETVLKLYHVKSCISAHLLLKKVLLGLCVLNALITTVCFTAVVLHYWQISASRRCCLGELQIEDQGRVSDPDDFVPPVPPPSYFAACNSDPPQMRTLVCDGLSLPNVYATQINGAEVFFHVDPPPPYEDVQSSNTSEQGGALQVSAMNCVDSVEESTGQDSQAAETCESSSRARLSSSNARLQKQSKSDAVLLHCHSPQGDDTCPGGHVIESRHVTYPIDGIPESCEDLTT